MHTVLSLSQTSPSAPGTTAGGSVITGLDEFETITAILELQGATGGILTVSLQTSEDGTTWYDWFRSNDFAAGASVSIITVVPFLSSSPVTVGKNTTPVLAKGTVRPGFWQSRMRALFECGAGMSAGAAQVIRIYGFRPSG